MEKKKINSSRWVKGQSGNPNGRPANSQLAQFREALIIVEEEMGGESLLLHAVRRAYKDKDATVLVAILKKLLPDLSSAEITNLTLVDIMEKINE